MTIIKATTKKGQTMLHNAKRKEGFSLADVYGKNSYTKEKAWYDCFRQYLNEHGTNFRIISHNCRKSPLLCSM